nr:TonB family protein [uncultured Cohaesibacter sp.]
MKRLALWSVGISVGVLLHLAIALAYWGELDGESRYDLGGAFAGDMLVSIMPDMGQGIAGGPTENLTNGENDEPLIAGAQGEVSSQMQQPDAGAAEEFIEKSEDPVSAHDVSQNDNLSNEMDVNTKAAHEDLDIREEPQATIAPEEEKEAASVPPLQELAEETQVVETEPAVMPDVAPDVAPEVTPDVISENVAPSQEKAETSLPDETAPVVAETEKPPVPAVEIARPAKAEEPEKSEEPVKKEAPAGKVSLLEGDALTQLPIVAPRAKITPQPKRTELAKADGDKGAISRTVSSHDRRMAGGAKAGAAKASGKVSGKVSGQDSGKASARGDGGSSNKAAGPGSKGVRASYSTLLRRWIERNKRYPRSAKMRGVRGSGVVRIVIDRSGRVLTATLVKSAGDRALDDEIRRLPLRASPAPKPPEEFSGARHSLTLPVRFSR